MNPSGGTAAAAPEPRVGRRNWRRWALFATAWFLVGIELHSAFAVVALVPLVLWWCWAVLAGVVRGHIHPGWLLFALVDAITPLAVLLALSPLYDWRHAESTRRGDRVAAALERYCQLFGHYPDRLTALVPTVLPQLPVPDVSWIETREFQYRPTDEGYQLSYVTFLLAGYVREPDGSWKPILD